MSEPVWWHKHGYFTRKYLLCKCCTLHWLLWLWGLLMLPIVASRVCFGFFLNQERVSDPEWCCRTEPLTWVITEKPRVVQFRGMALLKHRPVRITHFVGQYILPENQMIKLLMSFADHFMPRLNSYCIIIQVHLLIDIEMGGGWGCIIKYPE